MRGGREGGVEMWSLGMRPSYFLKGCYSSATGKVWIQVIDKAMHCFQGNGARPGFRGLRNGAGCEYETETCGELCLFPRQV